MLCKKCQRLLAEDEALAVEGLCNTCRTGNGEGHPPDYYEEDGWLVFTEHYHLKRGYCCQRGCRHCPWKVK